MKIVAQRIPLFSRAVRVCDDFGQPQFVCIVTPKGWLGRIAWVWMGMGRLDLEIRKALREELTGQGHKFLQLERLKDGQLESRKHLLTGANDDA